MSPATDAANQHPQFCDSLPDPAQATRLARGAWFGHLQGAGDPAGGSTASSRARGAGTGNQRARAYIVFGDLVDQESPAPLARQFRLPAHGP